MNKYKVAIVGCSSIGALKPDKYDSPTTSNILTHAHAVYNHAQTDLVAVVDTNLEKAHAAVAKWKKDDVAIHTYWSDSIIAMMDMLRIDNPDIVIVTSPTKTHHTVLENILCHNYNKPKLVIAEKPFCDNTQQAEHIAQLYREADIPILINYTRRFDSYHQMVKLWIERGELGTVRHCWVVYTRGLKREASHAIDLCNWWFGECLHGCIMEYREDIHPQNFILCDYSKDDPSYTVHLRYKDGPQVYFSPMDGRDYSIFEIDVLGSKGRITLVNHGLSCRYYSVIPESVYGDYDTLDHTANNIDVHSRMKRALLHALCNAVDHLESGEPLKCTPEDALAVHRVYDMLRIKAIE